MTTRNLVLASGAALALAFVLGGCATEDEGGDPSKVQQGVTEPFDFAPEVVDPPQVKAAAEDDLTPKGSVTRRRGAITRIPLTLNRNDRLICRTSNNSADTVLAVVRCEDGTHCWPSSPATYSAQFKLQNFAFDDDSAGGLASYIDYTAPWTMNVYLLGFAYGNSVGTADLACSINGNSVVSGSYSFRGGSASSYSCTGGSAHTTGGGDPFMIGIEVLGNSGRMNDDCDYAGGNRESCLKDLYGGPMWYVFNGYNEGDTTLNCP